MKGFPAMGAGLLSAGTTVGDANVPADLFIFF